jgi:hypothetical protein
LTIDSSTKEKFTRTIKNQGAFKLGYNLSSELPFFIKSIQVPINTQSININAQALNTNKCF